MQDGERDFGVEQPPARAERERLFATELLPGSGISTPPDAVAPDHDRKRLVTGGLEPVEHGSRRIQ